MWSYVLRRLLAMIPTLFGVTIVSFVIMQIAPGDPMDNLGAGGLSAGAGQSREAYLIRKRDLKLDKPLLLNFNYFADYSSEVRQAARLLGRDTSGVERLLGELAEDPDAPEHQDLMAFLQALEIDDFRERLADTKQHARLAAAIRGAEQQGLMGGGLVRVWCEDAGVHGVPPAIELLQLEPRAANNDAPTPADEPTDEPGDEPGDEPAAAPVDEPVDETPPTEEPSEKEDASEEKSTPGPPESDELSEQQRLQLGAIHALNFMVVEPFRYTYPSEPSDNDTPEVQAVWRTWWDRARDEFPKLEPQRREMVEARFDDIVAAESRREQFARLDYVDPEGLESFQRADLRVFIERLLADDSSLREKEIASLGARLYLGRVLWTDVPTNFRELPEAEQAKLLREVSENWQLYYRLNWDRFHPGVATKVGAIFTDTQYANMAWRLVTFNFGRSTLKTREPVSQKILDAVLVSAPLMILAQLMIYMVAVPLGVVCAVNRGNAVDRSISFGLFLLYSIPPFVAAMLFLLVFAYGDWLRIFPMEGLHGDGADELSPLLYAIDYLWHIILPVTCLSLFSLAGMAMYSRTSMLDVIGQDYIRTARAKGLPEDTVIYKHGLRNSLIPILTLFSNLLPAMLGGSVLIEVIFGIPGMGTLSWASIEQKDFPTLMALIYIDAIVVMVSILLTDMLYVMVDPRISFGGQGGAA